MEKEELKISKDTRKFISDISKYSQKEYEKIILFLEKLENQQKIETELENKRGWRYMWQRTPKPYLLMMAYFVFLAPLGSVAYYSVSFIPKTMENFIPWYFIILALILFIPLIIVAYLSYHYVKNPKLHEVELKKENQ